MYYPLYHYTSCDIAFNFILRQMSLKANCLVNTDDPFELEQWTIEAKTRKPKPNRSKSNSPGVFINGINELLRAIDLEVHAAEILYNIKKRFKLQCFTTNTRNVPGWQNSALWYRYGDQYKGVCIEFDSAKLVKNTTEQFPACGFVADRVKYKKSICIPRIIFDDISDKGVINTVDRYILNNMHLLFYQKRKYWSFENEIRHLIYTDAEEPLYVSTRCAIKRLILGTRITMENLQIAKDLAQKGDFEIRTIRWLHGGSMLTDINE